jgi:hypothetical protein
LEALRKKVAAADGRTAVPDGGGSVRLWELAGEAEACVHARGGVGVALQTGAAIPRSPIVLYRGWLVNCASIAPINCIQFSCNRAMQLAANRMGALP